MARIEERIAKLEKKKKRMIDDLNRMASHILELRHQK